MNKAISTLTGALLASTIFVISGCGSDDAGTSAAVNYNGNTSAARIDNTNAEDIGTTSGEAVHQAGTADGNLPSFASITSTSSNTDVAALSRQLVDFVQNRSTTNLPVSFREAGSCGGFASGPDSEPPASGPYSITITFSENYCDSFIDSSLTFNGSFTISTTDTATFDSFTMKYVNFRVTQNGETTTLNLTVECNSQGCSFTSDFKAADGSVHRTADFFIYGDPVGGYNGDMTFYHSVYGSVTVTISNVTYGSCGNFPTGGTISYTGTGGSSGSISFVSDCTYSGTYDDGAGNSGVFSGSFAP